MDESFDDHLPGCLVQKLSSIQRGPREATLVRDAHKHDWAEAVVKPAPFDESVWLADTSAACHLRTPRVISKYMPEFYSHAVVQKDDSSQGDNLDLAKALALQTLEMQGAWQHQQAASQIYANCKVQPGVPFARPTLAHPKMVGAAGMVPNNMLKHQRKSPREPDLTRDPSEPHAAVRVPFQSASSLAEREGVKRRQPIARLHCKAFQFPVMQEPCDEDGRAQASRRTAAQPLRQPRDCQMLGSGFRIRRSQMVI
ncbi:hypothetical protein WJX79_007919 [Trebouxia sp. C0005]